MKLSISAVLFLMFISCSSKKSIKTDSNPVDSLIESNMREAGIVGLSAAIIVDKRVIWTKGYGYSDRDNKIPFTPNTIINIASISKTITGACLMHAVETKKMSLDEDINNYLPFIITNPFFSKEKITLRNLATHTSGIIDQDPLYGNTYNFGGDSQESLGDFLRNYFDPKGKYYKKENFLNAKPGSHYEYSNIAAGLAGYTIEIATGVQLNKYSKQHIFNPLKMDDTGWFISEIQLSNHSKLYYQEGDTIKSMELYGLTTYPDGGVRTSILDLSKFFTSLLNGGELDGVRILKNESVEEMIRPQFTSLNRPENVEIDKQNSGIFWSIRDNGTRVGHSGEDPGVNTRMRYDPSKQVGVILFMNTSLDETRMKRFGLIYDSLWNYALTLKESKATSR